MRERPPKRSSATASVPFMITHAMKARLRKRGYTDEQISNMRPAEAQEILSRSFKDGEFEPPQEAPAVPREAPSTRLVGWAFKGDPKDLTFDRPRPLRGLRKIPEDAVRVDSSGAEPFGRDGALLGNYRTVNPPIRQPFPEAPSGYSRIPEQRPDQTEALAGWESPYRSLRVDCAGYVYGPERCLELRLGIPRRSRFYSEERISEWAQGLVQAAHADRPRVFRRGDGLPVPAPELDLVIKRQGVSGLLEHDEWYCVDGSGVGQAEMKPKPASDDEIRTALRTVYSRCKVEGKKQPNINELWNAAKAELATKKRVATKKQVTDKDTGIGNEEEFKKLRRDRGRTVASESKK